MTKGDLARRCQSSAVWLATVLILWGCVQGMRPEDAPSPPAMVAVDGRALQVFDDDLAYTGLVAAIDESLAYLRTRPATARYHFGPDEHPLPDVIETLTHFKAFVGQRPSGAQLAHHLAKEYHVYRAGGRDGGGEVLFTGYYEPFLKGSRTPRGAFRHPIYGRPSDLMTADVGRFRTQHTGLELRGRLSGLELVPYADRARIEAEGLPAAVAPVLAWVNDPVALFFLHIQGSGRVYLDDGSFLNVHYHTTNGHPYRSIGKLLIDQGKISREAMSMQAIRDYLTRHPQEVPAVLNTNPSYVFFKLEKRGPLGYLNRPLTPGRSLALDRRIFPPGALVLVRTQKPLMTADGRIARWQPFTRLMLNQDTGGAIEGPGRADLFWGNGPYAEIAAGHLKHTGELYFFVRKQ